MLCFFDRNGRMKINKRFPPPAGNLPTETDLQDQEPLTFDQGRSFGGEHSINSDELNEAIDEETFKDEDLAGMTNGNRATMSQMAETTARHFVRQPPTPYVKSVGATPRVRVWLELGGPDGSGAVVVGQATTLTVRAIVPGSMGVRIVDCAALDGLGESTQQLLDERGCPIDEQVSESSPNWPK